MHKTSQNLLFAALVIAVPSQVMAGDAKKGAGGTTIVKCEICTRTTDSAGNRTTNCVEVSCDKLTTAKVAPSVPVGSACTLLRRGLAVRSGQVSAAHVCEPVRATNVLR